MANQNPELTIESLHAAIEAAIRGRFPGFATVEFYRDDQGESMPTPACLLEMTECEPSGDADPGGTGTLGALLRFEARIIMQVRDKAAALELRKAAVALATWLHQLGRFPGASTDPIQVIGATPDDWMAANGGFRGWVVEWAVPARLGENAWADTGGVVPSASFSFAPEIGAAHQSRYVPLPDGAP